MIAPNLDFHISNIRLLAPYSTVSVPFLFFVASYQASSLAFDRLLGLLTPFLTQRQRPRCANASSLNRSEAPHRNNGFYLL